MREIKFRAWDTRHKRYVSWDEIERSRLLGVFANNHNRGISNCVLEQYTGLKDKSGVEIYEGDIIAVPYCESPLSYGPSVEVGTDVYEVFWDTDMLRWELREIGKPHGIDGLCDYDESDIEVVGNAHENSELLEAE